MENELEVVNIRLVKEPSLYSEQTLDSPQAVVELMAKELSQYDREVFCILNMKNNGQVINMNLVSVATVYKGNIIKNLIMDCQSYTKYRPNETTGGIFVSWRRKEELPTGA